MSEELGKIEKPEVTEFKEGRKLYFVPVVYSGRESPADFREKFNRYWNQVENQMGALELKLGTIARVYHELIPVAGEEGIKAIKELNEKCYEVVSNRLAKGAQLEAIEEDELLKEMMDYGRCLAIGLQSQQVFSRIYKAYTEVSQKRNDYIAQQIDQTLKEDEIGILFMREGHQVQFAPDIQVFYISPPALDEIKRWLRDQEGQKEPEQKSD
jgi:hypothetical protein